MRVLVTGASGLIGRRLVPILLKAGHAVVATSRDPEALRRQLPPGVLPFGWDGREMLQVPGKVDAIVHLAGASIAGQRWTEAYKQELRDSRLVSTRRVAEFVARRRAQDRPQAVVVANAVGYYGILPDGAVTEQDPPGDDFLATLCTDWEAAANEAPTRVVTLRLGHVLSRDGGYLGALLPLARLGLAGPLGGGRQPMPWVHIDDVCGVILWSLSAPGVKGAYNVVAPDRIRQKDFVKALNRHTPLPNLVPIPGLALRARFGEAAAAMLGGQDVRPARLQLEGYDFGHERIEGALRDLLVRKRRKQPQSRAAALAKAHAMQDDEEVAQGGDEAGAAAGGGDGGGSDAGLDDDAPMRGGT